MLQELPLQVLRRPHQSESYFRGDRRQLTRRRPRRMFTSAVSGACSARLPRWSAASRPRTISRSRYHRRPLPCATAWSKRNDHTPTFAARIGVRSTSSSRRGVTNSSRRSSARRGDLLREIFLSLPSPTQAQLAGAIPAFIEAAGNLGIDEWSIRGPVAGQRYGGRLGAVNDVSILQSN